MRDALSGEMNRRQELLRSAGNFANVSEYERARANGADLEPLPALFIVVDEFSELLSQKPDFAELFVMIGRLGRSLHMHLLLASQRLEEGKLRGLDSHLSYRIGLKTFSAGESRSVLGVPDAYHLPSVPGSAFLKCDASEPTRFNTSYVSGEYVSPRIVCADRAISCTGSVGAQIVHRDAGEEGRSPGRARGGARARTQSRRPPSPRCSRSWWADYGATGDPRTRCGCHRWTKSRGQPACCRTRTGPHRRTSTDNCGCRWAWSTGPTTNVATC